MHSRGKGTLTRLWLVALGLSTFPALLGAGTPGPATVKPTGELRISLAFWGPSA